MIEKDSQGPRKPKARKPAPAPAKPAPKRRKRPAAPTTTTMPAAKHHPGVTITEIAPSTTTGSDKAVIPAERIQHHPGVTITEYAPQGLAGRRGPARRARKLKKR